MTWRIIVYDGVQSGTTGKIVRRGHIRAKTANKVLTIAAMAISGRSTAVTMVAEPMADDEDVAPSAPFVVVWEN